MKPLLDNEIKTSIANVENTLLVEGLNMNKFSIINSQRFLRGQINNEEAIENITKYIRRMLEIQVFGDENGFDRG